MKEHERGHTVDKPIACDCCGKSYKNAATLRVHKRMHTRENLHQCNLCRKVYTQAGGLEQHRRTHTGERPFKCTHCGKRFNQKGHLNEHLARHTEKIPFECDLCGEGFSCKISLTKHKETHTAEAPSETDEQKTVRFSLRELLSNFTVETTEQVSIMEDGTAQRKSTRFISHILDFFLEPHSILAGEYPVLISCYDINFSYEQR